MKKRAVAYTNDVILGRSGQIITREYQRKQIAAYAEKNEIEILAWFEDEMYCEDVLMRPGIQALLAFEEEYDLCLVERVWALSRKMAVCEELFKCLDKCNAAIDTATYMWDCTSQMVRRRFNPNICSPVAEKEAAYREDDKKEVAVPRHYHFADITHHLH